MKKFFATLVLGLLMGVGGTILVQKYTNTSDFDYGDYDYSYTYDEETLSQQCPQK